MVMEWPLFAFAYGMRREGIWSLRLARQIVGKRSTTELCLSLVLMFDSSATKAIPEIPNRVDIFNRVSNNWLFLHPIKKSLKSLFQQSVLPSLTSAGWGFARRLSGNLKDSKVPWRGEFQTRQQAGPAVRRYVPGWRNGKEALRVVGEMVEAERSQK